jgi:hypothetical protein
LTFPSSSRGYYDGIVDLDELGFDRLGQPAPHAFGGGLVGIGDGDQITHLSSFSSIASLGVAGRPALYHAEAGHREAGEQVDDDDLKREDRQ